ncbi:hypothetical protein HHI36_020182 [Cryptolaemus montrouzieri]|uniref:Uncharacterized protein n=1 Tax=Cryptolaemus montrouzieri TaxID=559131 RepID=A0ABD2NAK3_9CUCU
MAVASVAVRIRIYAFQVSAASNVISKIFRVSSSAPLVLIMILRVLYAFILRPLCPNHPYAYISDCKERFFLLKSNIFDIKASCLGTDIQSEDIDKKQEEQSTMN